MRKEEEEMEDTEPLKYSLTNVSGITSWKPIICHHFSNGFVQIITSAVVSSKSVFPGKVTLLSLGGFGEGGKSF